MTFTKFLSAVFLFVAALFLTSCSRCEDNPRARLINNGTEKADIQIKTSGGNTENINNVMPGKFSDYRSYAPGQVTYTVTVGNTEYVKVFDVVTCHDYDVSIDANHVITVIPINKD